MRNDSSIVFSGIAPHPPIMVPEVGRDAITDVRSSIDAMREFTRRLIATGAETVVFISPHAPLDPYAFVAYEGPSLHGDFSHFRASGTRVEAPMDKELLDKITEISAQHGLDVIGIEGYELDHGTAVPLYFLQRNGWQGSIVAFGYSFLSNEDHLLFGECVRKAADVVARPIAFLASGDLSHRLKPEAPAGYNPTACMFDQEVIDALRSNAPERIINLDQNLRKLAGECGYRSLLVALGIARQLPHACEVLSYEAPFGVGYLVAQITSSQDADKRDLEITDQANATKLDPALVLPALARRAVERFVLSGELLEPRMADDGLLTARAACFVSIKTREGELRGCIGTIQPVKNTLFEELIANAINAATRDPRFRPIEAGELENLSYSVDILSDPEPAQFEDLDPETYGVVVEDEAGLHRGLLLPDIEGVNSAAQQVEIAARKAGLSPTTPLRLFRFRVERFREREPDRFYARGAPGAT
jgi:MEMO1 family protein